MRYGPDAPEATYIPHVYEEHSFDTGEVTLNYATTGSAANPAILLIPGQTESWWGYEEAMGLLADQFQVFAVDLRGQGRSSRTPGRYTFDNFGNDLVRFVGSVVGRPVVASGLSSGGIIAAWLSAYAPVGSIRGAHYEDPPLFASEVTPAFGPGIRQGAGPIFQLFNKYLGDQWSVGDVQGLLEAAPRELPGWLGGAVVGMVGSAEEPAQNLKEYDPEWGRAFWTGSVAASCDHSQMLSRVSAEEPAQNLKEYDPEWGRAFWTGSVAASCDHSQMLSRVRCPVLFTHHAWRMGEGGNLIGAISGPQVEQVKRLVTAAGQPFVYKSFPETPHSMHGDDPALYARTVIEWASSLPKEALPATQL